MSDDTQHENQPTAQTSSTGVFAVWLDRLSLLHALALVIAAAALLVLVGYLQYWSSQNRKYDIARPGQTSESKALDVTQTESNLAIPVTIDDVDSQLQFLAEERAILEGMNKLKAANLSDQDLRLVPSQQPSL